MLFIRKIDVFSFFINEMVNLGFFFFILRNLLLNNIIFLNEIGCVVRLFVNYIEFRFYVDIDNI